MMKFIFIFIILISTLAHASDITDAFKRRDFNKISDIYRDNPKRPFSDKELIYISYSLRKLGFYRQDIKLNIRLIKKKYSSYHKKLLRDVSRGETIDGDEYPDALKVLYWNLMNDYGKILEGYHDASTLIKKDHQHYLVFSKLLSELEFREGKVDKLNDRIVAHIQLLENKVYKFTKSLSFQYISWQTEVKLTGPESSGLVVTNRGLCLGGDIGWENSFYHFYLDGCAFAGSGGVSADASSPVTYKQSNVPAYGAKFGPGASMIVSSSGSRIGFRVPVIYTIQHLQEPANSNYSIDQDNPVSYLASLYSRWQFKSWYFQTEFGHYIQKEQTYWGLGIGKKF
ncbi:MAG: hypothetical protein ACLGHN_10190 [Bacteriovoracia bacterium]